MSSATDPSKNTFTDTSAIPSPLSNDPIECVTKQVVRRRRRKRKPLGVYRPFKSMYEEEMRFLTPRQQVRVLKYLSAKEKFIKTGQMVNGYYFDRKELIKEYERSGSNEKSVEMMCNNNGVHNNKTCSDKTRNSETYVEQVDKSGLANVQISDMTVQQRPSRSQCTKQRKNNGIKRKIEQPGRANTKCCKNKTVGIHCKNTNTEFNIKVKRNVRHKVTRAGDMQKTQNVDKKTTKEQLKIQFPESPPDLAVNTFQSNKLREKGHVTYNNIHPQLPDYRQIALNCLVNDQDNTHTGSDTSSTRNFTHNDKIQFIQTIKKLHSCSFRSFIEYMEIPLIRKDKFQKIFNDILSRFVKLECC